MHPERSSVRGHSGRCSRSTSDRFSGKGIDKRAQAGPAFLVLCVLEFSVSLICTPQGIKPISKRFRESNWLDSRTKTQQRGKHSVKNSAYRGSQAIRNFSLKDWMEL